MADEPKLLKSLEISYYRGFKEKQTIEFAVPNNKQGGGLTVIVGPNNTGKTSIIEALSLTNNSTINDDEVHPDGQLVIKQMHSNGLTFEITKEENSPKVKTKGERLAMEFIPSRRYWDGTVSSGATNANYMSSGHPRIGSGGGVGQILDFVNKNPEEKEKLRALMKRLIPNLSDFGIGADDAGEYVKYIVNNFSHRARYLGDGVLSLFKICVHLISEKHRDKLFIIDEPELSLHPQTQKQLAKIISEHAATRQILICTHSAYFANWSDLLNGAKFIRMNKHNDKNCSVHQLDHKATYVNIIAKSVEEWQRPQLLDAVAKEVLFSNKVLFLEGQEDVGLIKNWLAENIPDYNFEIFGYGVGGFSNLTHFLKIAKDLGIEKVAAIFDKGKNENKAFEKAKKDYPQYCIKQLPSDDIRDKEKKICEKCKTDESPSKIGVFDKEGKIKEKYNQDFQVLMKDICNYMG